jgi:hypothetical protein
MSRHSAILGWAATVAMVAGLPSCSIPLVNRWDAKPVVVQPVPADADVVYENVADALERLGLVVTDARPDNRVVQLNWVTAPGDGRQYLRCHSGERIGSASLQPRILVRPAEHGSVIEISSYGRATAASACVSTGQFERWLLAELGPAVAAAALAP